MIPVSRGATGGHAGTVRNCFSSHGGWGGGGRRRPMVVLAVSLGGVVGQ